MNKKIVDENARRAIDEMRLEISEELGIENINSNLDPTMNIFTAGTVGGLMTRNMVEMGQKQFIDKKKPK